MFLWVFALVAFLLAATVPRLRSIAAYVRARVPLLPLAISSSAHSTAIAPTRVRERERPRRLGSLFRRTRSLDLDDVLPRYHPPATPPPDLPLSPSAVPLVDLSERRCVDGIQPHPLSSTRNSTLGASWASLSSVSTASLHSNSSTTALVPRKSGSGSAPTSRASTPRSSLDAEFRFPLPLKPPPPAHRPTHLHGDADEELIDVGVGEFDYELVDVSVPPSPAPWSTAHAAPVPQKNEWPVLVDVAADAGTETPRTRTRTVSPPIPTPVPISVPTSELVRIASTTPPASPKLELMEVDAEPDNGKPPIPQSEREPERESHLPSPPQSPLLTFRRVSVPDLRETVVFAAPDVALGHWQSVELRSAEGGESEDAQLASPVESIPDEEESVAVTVAETEEQTADIEPPALAIVPNGDNERVSESPEPPSALADIPDEVLEAPVKVVVAEQEKELGSGLDDKEFKSGSGAPLDSVGSTEEFALDSTSADAELRPAPDAVEEAIESAVAPEVDQQEREANEEETFRSNDIDEQLYDSHDEHEEQQQYDLALMPDIPTPEEGVSEGEGGEDPPLLDLPTVLSVVIEEEEELIQEPVAEFGSMLPTHDFDVAIIPDPEELPLPDLPLPSTTGAVMAPIMGDEIYIPECDIALPDTDDEEEDVEDAEKTLVAEPEDKDEQSSSESDAEVDIGIPLLRRRRKPATEQEDVKTAAVPVPGTFPADNATESPKPAQNAGSGALASLAAAFARRRSPLDAALAMQLRPGLGVGADGAWLVRFLMSFFGWLAVLVAGGQLPEDAQGQRRGQSQEPVGVAQSR